MTAETARRHRIRKRWKRILRGRIASYLTNQSAVGNPAIFDTQLFPWAQQLECDSAWRSVRREAEDILAVANQLPAFQEISPDQQRISPDEKWKTFFFQGIGYRCERNLARCPETARLLSGIPGLETAFFSILAPGKRIKRHRGVTKGLIRCHLPLIVPAESEQCGMRINKRTVGWEEGKLLIFDDTRKHRVWNDTEDWRVVLLFDVRRPMKRPGRILLAAILRALRWSRYVQDARINEAAWEARFYAH